MSDKPRYACVFASWREGVVVVRKNHPEWQFGRWNGVGGACNEGETPLQAAQREFTEETRIGAPDDLNEFCVLEDSKVIVHFYRGSLPDHADIPSMLPKKNDIGEPLALLHIGKTEWTDSGHHIDNLSWLIPMAFADSYHMHATVTAYRRARDSEDSPWHPVL